ncbi:hypothetical protein CONLIGDRAFT_574343 [Coniochaeta ligniaria NRRL 30616]|uniref:Aminoglycoside phosphotransferase domain-containing protein n=1 Tax=Coniochaeta ligniaria NRRL 30616 TaxID=1408157 RepID=A0A1J7ITY0_9PEZI|nr:hypothetical protein CONLIGDRAFT_574343 [Coniochaeta ligniaria NRRL 30616]
MPALSEAEEAALSNQLLQELAPRPPFACSSLTRLSGGSTNFVYRGTLATPRPSGVKTVIVKHFKGSLSINRDFPVDISRCIIELVMLSALPGFSLTTTALVRTPFLYYHNSEANTQIHTDFSDTTDLRAVLLSNPTLDNSISPSFPPPLTLGRKIGSWLRGFHNWASSPPEYELRAEIGQYESMRKLKHLVNYGTLIGILQKFPDVLDGSGDLKALEEVKAMADRELERQPALRERLPPRRDDHLWGIIHGDFCMLNVLVSNDSKRAHHEAGDVDKLFVIDWELAQYNHRAYDLGHMIGDLYEQKHFNDADSAMLCVRGFVEGYGGLSDELAFRTAIHVGTQLIGGYNRRPKRGNATAPEEMIVDMLRVAKDFVVKGWEKDREWFEGSPLAPLFTNK